jgi:uncharacterized integral membrane protein
LSPDGERGLMKPKTILLLVAAAILIVVLVQNSKLAEIKLLFWPIKMPVVILVPGIFLLGFFAGFWRAHFGPRRTLKRPGMPPPPPAQLPGS